MPVNIDFVFTVFTCKCITGGVNAKCFLTAALFDVSYNALASHLILHVYILLK